MSYFRSFPKVPYRFGTKKDPVVFTKLNAYVDLLDEISHEVGFYREYYIPDGERPDTLSFRLYGNSNFYWTFFLLNDQLRELGWPVDDGKLRPFLRERFPHTTFVTRDLTTLYTDFKMGQRVQTQSGASVAIVDRNLDLGQVITELVIDDNTGTVLRLESDVTKSVFIQDQKERYISTHHYETTAGEWIDIDPENPQVSLLADISYLEEYQRINEERRQIKILKADVVESVVREFNKKLSE